MASLKWQGIEEEPEFGSVEASEVKHSAGGSEGVPEQPVRIATEPAAES